LSKLPEKCMSPFPAGFFTNANLGASRYLAESTLVRLAPLVSIGLIDGFILYRTDMSVWINGFSLQTLS